MYFISVLYYKEKINNTVETPETNMEEHTFKKKSDFVPLYFTVL